jgi:hypothetical protein
MRIPPPAPIAILAAILLLPATTAVAQLALPQCGRQAVERLTSRGVDPATLASAQSVPVQNGTNGSPSQYQVWFTSNACQGGYIVLVRTDCVPVGVEGGRGQCAMPDRR